MHTNSSHPMNAFAPIVVAFFKGILINFVQPSNALLPTVTGCKGESTNPAS